MSQSYLADIKRTAKFRLLDDGSVNYLADRIRPWVRVRMPSDDRSYIDVMDDYLDGLIAHCDLNETSGTTAHDSTGERDAVNR